MPAKKLAPSRKKAPSRKAAQQANDEQEIERRVAERMADVCKTMLAYVRKNLNKGEYIPEGWHEREVDYWLQRTEHYMVKAGL